MSKEDNKQWETIYTAIPYNVDSIVLPDFTREEIANCVNEALNKLKSTDPSKNNDNLIIGDVMPSFSFNNYTKQNGDCDDCVLMKHCKTHVATVIFECKEYYCLLEMGFIWA